MDNKQKLEQQLWNIANTFRGKMGVDNFRDCILGFKFYKYLSENMQIYADQLLKPDGIKHEEIDTSTSGRKESILVMRDDLFNISSSQIGRINAR